jgi:hypothetical protein
MADRWWPSSLARSIEFRVEDLLSLRKAVDGLLKTFGVDVIA